MPHLPKLGKLFGVAISLWMPMARRDYGTPILALVCHDKGKKAPENNQTALLDIIMNL